MFKTIALKWEYRINKSRFDTILLESYFGRMLRESDDVHVLMSEDGCERHTFLLDSNYSFETAAKRMTLEELKDFLVDCQYALEKAEERRK